MQWPGSTRQELSFKRTFILFGVILLLLIAIGVAGYRVASEGVNSREWMIHAFQVQAAVQDLRLSLFEGGGARRNYLLLGDARYLQDFENARNESANSIQRLHELVLDSREQQQRLAHVEALALERFDLLQNSIDRYRDRHETLAQQSEIEISNIKLSQQITDLLQAMYGGEQSLLEQRRKTARQMYQGTIVILVISFVLAAGLLGSNFLLLYGELKRRRETEKTLVAVGNAYRRLSARLLELQDQERRRLARELHDSAGQYLAILKMNLTRMSASGNISDDNQQLLSESLQWVDRTISEVRTVSHLLHPPMLDEVGFSSAGRWYIEEFGKRSGIQVDLTIPDDGERIAPDAEMVLFRVLQEGLTNVHRHSGARKVDVKFTKSPNEVTLSLRDHGHGMSAEALERFRSGTGMGVGLAGMRERVAELGGTMTIDSDARGTTVRVRLPARSNQQSAEVMGVA